MLPNSRSCPPIVPLLNTQTIQKGLLLKNDSQFIWRKNNPISHDTSLGVPFICVRTPSFFIFLCCFLPLWLWHLGVGSLIKLAFVFKWTINYVCFCFCSGSRFVGSFLCTRKYNHYCNHSIAKYKIIFWRAVGTELTIFKWIIVELFQFIKYQVPTALYYTYSPTLLVIISTVGDNNHVTDVGH